MTAARTRGIHPLDHLLSPRSIAIIGASDRNHYSNLAMRALRGVAFAGPIRLVNQRGAPAYGLQSVRSCTGLDDTLDAAYLCLPLAGVLDATRDALAAGIRNLVVLTSGFAETGPERVLRETELLALCAAAGAGTGAQLAWFP